jgi:hypothetical protein
MCYERHWARRREANENEHVWQEFERTRPLDELEPDDTRSEPAEAREEIAVSER